jgi:Ca2+-binding RTX toxin-like protein
VLRGGAGRDVVEYSNYTKPITVDLDGASRDDGLSGEHDTVGADVEDLNGGSGNDRLIGNGAANEINGWGGNDVIRGAGGNDALSGWDGNDQVYGEAGNDTLHAASGSNLLDGGLNEDVCIAKADDTLTSCETYQPW